MDEVYEAYSVKMVSKEPNPEQNVVWITIVVKKSEVDFGKIAKEAEIRKKGYSVLTISKTEIEIYVI